MPRGTQRTSGIKANHDWRFESDPMVVYGFGGLPIHERHCIGRSELDDDKRVEYIQEVIERRRLPCAGKEQDQFGR